jgi:mono/diheme cytochrome c family protein
MHLNEKQARRWHSAAWQVMIVVVALIVLATVLVACAPVAAPAGEAAATEAAATEAATEAPAEEATESPAEEATAAPAEEIAMVGDPARGGYIFAVTTGCGCHFNRDLAAPAGGNKFEGPFGVVYAPNITSDPETGIGAWSETDIVNALRLGVRPDGSQLHPIMPYMAYSNLADQDAYDLAAALKMVPPAVNAVPASELAAAPAPFTPANTSLATAPAEGVERGAYIVAVANCGRCHTPRGGKRRTRHGALPGRRSDARYDCTQLDAARIIQHQLLDRSRDRQLPADRRLRRRHTGRRADEEHHRQRHQPPDRG